jgi:hypothetical protein
MTLAVGGCESSAHRPHHLQWPALRSFRAVHPSWRKVNWRFASNQLYFSSLTDVQKLIFCPSEACVWYEFPPKGLTLTIEALGFS